MAKLHMVAFGGAAQDYSAGLVTVPFLADGLIRASSNVIQLTDNWNVLWSFVGGVNISRVRLSSAQSRLRGFPNLYPMNNTHLSGDNPPVNDCRQDPLKLYSGENVSLQATNAAAADAIVLLGICQGNPNYNVNVSGLRKIRFTASITSIAYGWSGEGNVTLDDDIEAGDYGVFGMSVFEADIIAARLVFKNQVERPGLVCPQTAVQRPWPEFWGGMGLWGTFSSITPPFIQAIHVAAAAQTLTGYLYCAKL